MPTSESRRARVATMIALRRKLDAALLSKPPPAYWIGPHVWASPEYLIYSVLRGIVLMEGDGVAEPEAVRQVDAKRGFHVLAPGTDAVSPAAYLVRLLRAVAPGYLEHGPDLLADAIVIARAGLRELPPAPWDTPDGCPPEDWRWERMEPERERKMLRRRPPAIPRSGHDEEWIDLVVRMQPGDELWEWSSPSRSWGLMMGRGGIALVRDGRVLCDLTTRMN
jgi:hypothetical protein